MSCEDRGRQTTEEELRAAGWRRTNKTNPEHVKRRLDNVSRLFCFVLRRLDEEQPSWLNGLCSENPTIALWWEEYKEGDRKAQLIEQAKAKLTSEELVVLIDCWD